MYVVSMQIDFEFKILKKCKWIIVYLFHYIICLDKLLFRNLFKFLYKFQNSIKEIYTNKCPKIV